MVAGPPSSRPGGAALDGPTDELVIIAPRFNGPPTSAHGGYCSGLIARRVPGPAEVTLRAPPALGRPLLLVREAGGVALRDDDGLVAEARPIDLDLDLPSAPSLARAQAATPRFPWRAEHPLPTCFACGTARAPGDGLRIFCGPTDDTPGYAAPWTPAPAFATGRDASGRSSCGPRWTARAGRRSSISTAAPTSARAVERTSRRPRRRRRAARARRLGARARGAQAPLGGRRVVGRGSGQGLRPGALVLAGGVSAAGGRTIARPPAAVSLLAAQADAVAGALPGSRTGSSWMACAAR
jgi:hypothetical protein